MPRTCFVIMPFSTTESCSEEDWTLLFESLFKPAVEGANLDYECHRSSATRGNIVGAIIQDLNESYVVLADLTDQNANVFYELGVRHTLRHRTILIAQREEDIPFDLRAYAYHIYNWQTEEGKANFTNRMTELISEIDTNPERPDNPVSDFLGRREEPVSPVPPASISPSEVSYVEALAGSLSGGLNAVDFARRLSHEGRGHPANTVLRLTRVELIPLFREMLDRLNQEDINGPVPREEIIDKAMHYISQMEPLITKTEEFVLTTIEENWQGGVWLGTKLSGDLISLTERPPGGHIIRYVQGTPALLAWRLLILSGAKALADESFSILNMILKEPIEVEEQNGSFSNIAFNQRRDLFYPEAFLGYADLPMQYLAKLYNRQSHLHRFFISEEEYQLAVAKFLIVVTLSAPPGSMGHPLYPGYRLFPQSRRAMSSFCSRLTASETYLDEIAQSIGETTSSLKESWTERVRLINGVNLGSGRILFDDVLFPETLTNEVPD